MRDAPAPAAAGHADVGNVRTRPHTTGRTGSSSIALGTVKDEAKSLPDLNEMADGAGAGFRRRAVERHAHQPCDARLERRPNRPEGGRRAGAAERSRRSRSGTACPTRWRTSKPGAHIDLLVARNNLPVEISGTLRAAGGHRAAAAAVRRGRMPSGRVDLTRDRQHRPGRDDARRHRVHAAGVAGSVRLQQAGEGRRQRQNRVRQAASERSPDAAEVGRARQRSDDAVRGGDHDRSH